jgi:hypothetical protein
MTFTFPHWSASVPLSAVRTDWSCAQAVPFSPLAFSVDAPLWLVAANGNSSQLSPSFFPPWTMTVPLFLKVLSQTPRRFWSAVLSLARVSGLPLPFKPQCSSMCPWAHLNRAAEAPACLMDRLSVGVYAVTQPSPRAATPLSQRYTHGVLQAGTLCTVKPGADHSRMYRLNIF